MSFLYEPLVLPKLEREHIGDKRLYFKPNDKDKKFISITTITSFFNRHIFINWRKKVGNEEADKITKASTTRGTDLHTLNECYLQGIDPPEVPEISKTLFQLNKPALDKIGKIYGIELGMYSEYLGIAGTCDLVAEYEGELSIIDYKTSKKPKPRAWLEHYFVQCCAYSCMLNELTGLEAKKLVIIMSCENGELIVYEERDIKKYIKLLIKYIKNYVAENTND
jgi:genome maintenance exonuclease 1